MSKLISKTVKVGLLDDHPMVREGVGNVVRGTEGAELAFSHADPEDCLAYLREHPLDVLLLDVSLGDRDGLSLIKEFLEIQPRLNIVILTVSDSETFLVQALTQGASGYLLKDCDGPQISAAIMAAARGLAVLAPVPLLTRVLQGWLHNEPSGDASGPTLSDRELAVLRCVAAGDSNKEIAAKLHLAESTIKKYSHNAMGKLGTSNRGAAAIRAMRLGLISLEAEND